MAFGEPCVDTERPKSRQQRRSSASREIMEISRVGVVDNRLVTLAIIVLDLTVGVSS